MVMLLHWPAVQSSFCDCLTVEGDNVLGHMPGVLAGAQAGRKQSSDIIKSSGSAVVSLQNTHSPLGCGQGCSVISGSGPNNPILISTWDQLSSLFGISSVQAINKIYLRRQMIQYMIIFLDPVPTPCFVLWEVVLSLQCRRAIELVSIIQMFLRLNLLCRAQSWTSSSVQLNKWSLGEVSSISDLTGDFNCSRLGRTQLYPSVFNSFPSWQRPLLDTPARSQAPQLCRRHWRRSSSTLNSCWQSVTWRGQRLPKPPATSVRWRRRLQSWRPSMSR